LLRTPLHAVIVPGLVERRSVIRLRSDEGDVLTRMSGVRVHRYVEDAADGSTGCALCVPGARRGRRTGGRRWLSLALAADIRVERQERQF